MRWHVIRTLLTKERLRYRYNWGLLVMVAVLTVLSLLISVGSRMQLLPGQAGIAVQRCVIEHRKGSRWSDYLGNHLPSDGSLVVRFREVESQDDPPAVPELALVARLLEPSDSNGEWRIEYWYTESAQLGILPYRDWLSRRSTEFLETRPRLRERARLTETALNLNTPDIVSQIMSALVLFTIYLLSFNLFLTSTAEERERRQILALALTPASPSEILAAKCLFYGGGSLAVTLTIVAAFNPRLLLNPLLLSTVVVSSVAYVSIGTVVVTLVRRQSTINTISLLYVTFFATILGLAAVLPPFRVLQAGLIEYYIRNQLRMLFNTQQAGQLLYVLINQAGLWLLTGIWVLIAVRLFARRGIAVSGG